MPGKAREDRKTRQKRPGKTRGPGKTREGSRRTDQLKLGGSPDEDRRSRSVANNKENHIPERPETAKPPKMTRRSHFPLLHAQGLEFPPPVGKGALHFCDPATQSRWYLSHFSDPAIQSKRYLLHSCGPRKQSCN